MRWALERGYEIVFEMDADGSHPADRIEAMIAAIQDADLVIGSRWVPGGSVVNWPRRRLIISRLGSWYARTALGLYVKDATGGFRAYRATALKRVLQDARVSQGYAFQLDMLRNSALQQYSIVEVPITFVERTHGSSKMSAAIVFEAMLLVTWWALKSLPRRLVKGRWHTQVRGLVAGQQTQM
jgi:dolichol-phosphate mannosyltransferase